jgi:hypothetical protein
MSNYFLTIVTGLFTKNGEPDQIFNPSNIGASKTWSGSLFLVNNPVLSTQF